MKFYERVINDFGGYEKCKDILSQPNIGFIMNVEALRRHMLEYRRQHNIFEVGDKVVAPILHGYFVGKIIAYRSDIDRFDVMGSRHWGWFFAHQLKHATDAEIKAGKDWR